MYLRCAERLVECEVNLASISFDPDFIEQSVVCHILLRAISGLYYCFCLIYKSRVKYSTLCCYTGLEKGMCREVRLSALNLFVVLLRSRGD